MGCVAVPHRTPGATPFCRKTFMGCFFLQGRALPGQEEDAWVLPLRGHRASRDLRRVVSSPCASTSLSLRWSQTDGCPGERGGFGV